MNNYLPYYRHKICVNDSETFEVKVSSSERKCLLGFLSSKRVNKVETQVKKG